MLWFPVFFLAMRSLFTAAKDFGFDAGVVSAFTSSFWGTAALGFSSISTVCEPSSTHNRTCAQSIAEVPIFLQPWTFLCARRSLSILASRILHVDASKHSQVAHSSYSTPHCGLSSDTNTSPIYQDLTWKSLPNRIAPCVCLYIYIYNILEDAYYLWRTPINLCTTLLKGLEKYNYVYKMWIEKY